MVQAFLSALPEEQQQQQPGAGIEAPAVRVLTVAGLMLERSFTMAGEKKCCICPTSLPLSCSMSPHSRGFQPENTAVPTPSQVSSWTCSFRPHPPQCCRRADAA